MAKDEVPMRMEVLPHREQSAEEIAVWNRWTTFTDKAKLPPDCPRDYAYIAKRFNEETRGMTTPEIVKSIVPENHPNYPWDR